ncbi:DUF1440 domain-containing protein [Staphylococcus epidermidis]
MKHQKNQSRFKLLIAGIIAGLLSGVVKLGWEVMFPPRTPSRDATNPPQQLLQLLGIPSDITHLTYNFSEHALPWISFIVHYSFFYRYCNNLYLYRKEIYKNHTRLWCFIWYSYLDCFFI